VGCDESCSIVRPGDGPPAPPKERRAADRAASATKAKTYRLKQVALGLPGGETAILKLKPKDRETTRALKRARKAMARIRVAVTDRTGNSATRRLVVRLTR
jgi:hypothetical protein